MSVRKAHMLMTNSRLSLRKSGSYAQRGNNDVKLHSVYWTPCEYKEEGFYNNVEAGTGIKKEFIKWSGKFVMNTMPAGCVGLPGSTMPQKA
jgi:hypothetical protein